MTDGEVRLEPPVVDQVRQQVRDPAATWDRDYLAESLQASQVEYFSIIADDELVGEIFLHDIDVQRGDALVGYALFQPVHRGRGIGSEALSELVSHVVTNTELNKLVVITMADNVASVRTAEKSGFIQVGAPREDPAGVCLVWRRGPKGSDESDQRLDKPGGASEDTRRPG